MSVGYRSGSQDSLKAYHDADDTLHAGLASPTKFTPTRRRKFFATFTSVVIVLLIVLAYLSYWSSHSPPLAQQEVLDEPFHQNTVETSPSQNCTPGTANVEVGLDPLDPLAVLYGPPTTRFRDNLRPDQKYITSWISAGWTNDVMTYMNLIYLGLITDRIPIIPMFTPSHIGGSVPPIFFGDVFDVPRLRRELGKPILEWREVKDAQSDTLDELGCWNLWQSVQYREDTPRRSVVPDHLSLDISYTKAPSWIKLIPNYEHDQHSTFWSIASLAFPEGRAANLVTPLESPHHKVALPPDEQVACFDYLYYVCAHQPFEFDFDFSPAWRYVGQYMHWNPQLATLRDKYLRQTMGVDDDEPVPPYIAIHVRHGDFANWCGDVPIEDCFASTTIIARRVREIQAELLIRGINAQHVIMTSDERKSTWWEDVAKEGWLQVDHSTTAQYYGHWYPVLIDAAIQSGGVGFVGNDRSTMSILARRRAQSWQNAVVRTVKWGRPNSDDHETF